MQKKTGNAFQIACRSCIAAHRRGRRVIPTPGEKNTTGKRKVFPQWKTFNIYNQSVMYLSRHVHRPFFPDHGHFDLPRECHFRLDLLCDLKGKFF
jgi:hypothetical protein